MNYKKLAFFFLTPIFVNHLAHCKNTHILIKGKTLPIELPSNAASTGYSWILATPLDSTSKIKIIRSGYKSPKSNLIGALGIQFWIIQGIRKGQQVLLFEKKRPWQPNTAASETKVFLIDVK